MPDCDESGGNRQPTKRKRIWLVPVGIALLAVIVGFLWTAGVFGNRRSADERLAEIEAARAIPDSENAAIIYDELLRDSHATSLLDYCPDFLQGPVFNQRLNEPWRSRDHPELAAWISENQYIIDKLVEASKLEKCRFPISIDLADTSTVARAAPMRQWGFLVTFAANNDLAERRLDAALTKWRCLLQIANHLRQQPVLVDHMGAEGVARLALEPVVRFVVAGDPSPEHLERIEAMPLQLADDWDRHVSLIRSIERLTMQKVTEPFSLWGRLKFRFSSYRMQRAMSSAAQGTHAGSPLETTGTRYRRHITTARGLRILIALQRYHSATGRWPESLDAIRSSLSKEILADPLSKGPFVYKPSGDTFTLYSKGENNIYEDGRHKSDGPDDWPIWPGRKREIRSEPDDEPNR